MPREINKKEYVRMKTVVRILALALVFAMAVTMLVSCGARLSGTYENSEKGEVFVFDGKEFTVTTGTTQLKGTYEIKEDGEETRIILLIDERVADGRVTKLEEPRYMHSEKGLVLRQGEGYISIGEDYSFVRYNKK